MYYKRIYNSKKDYYQGLEAFCDLNASRLLLENNGIQNALLYLDASMYFEFDFSKKIENYYNKLFKKTRERGVLKPNDKNLIKKFYYNDIGLENDLNLLKKEGPLAVGVDSYYLSYMKEYKKIHSWHTIILCGVTEDKNSLYIIDWAEPWFFKGLVPVSEFLKARSSKNELNNNDIYSGLPILNYTLQINKKWEIIEGKTLLKKVIELSIENYYTLSEERKLSMTNIKRIIDYIKDIYTNEKIDNFKELLDCMYKQIYINLKRYKFFREYISYAYNCISLSKEIKDLEKNILDVIMEWELFSISLLKLKTNKSDIILDKFISRGNKLYESEIKIGKQLKNILDGGF